MLTRIRLATTLTIDNSPIPSGGGPLRDCDQPAPIKDLGEQDGIDVHIVDERGFNSGTLARASTSANALENQGASLYFTWERGGAHHEH